MSDSLRIPPLSARRLKGFLLKRLKATNAVWVRLDYKNFMEMSGLTERTVIRAKNWLEENDESFKFRTISKEEGRGWQVIVALEERLKHDREPLFYKADGRNRNVRTSLRGERVDCSQLQFIEGEIQERKVEEDPPEEREEIRDPRQLEFGTILAQRYRIRKLKREGYDAFVDPVSGLIQLRVSSGLTDMPSIGGRKSKISADCSKHVRGQAPAGSWFSVTTDERIRDRERLRSLPQSERKDVLSRPIWKDKGGKGHVRLAHFLKRRLEHFHYDNCKVAYNPRHAFQYALAGLQAGWDATALLDAYDIALHQRHQDATDLGEVFSPSSTVSLAKSILADRLQKSA